MLLKSYYVIKEIYLTQNMYIHFTLQFYVQNIKFTNLIQDSKYCML